MRKTEEAFCNGITFSISRLVPSSLQEGETEDAKYYAYVLITPTLDKLILKIWDAPSYEPITLNGEHVESITFDMEVVSNDDEETDICGYNYGDSVGEGAALIMGDNNATWIRANQEQTYNGLMIYPAVKCIIVDTIKYINKLNNEG